jgi:cobalamin transport system substrate-binding protein
MAADPKSLRIAIVAAAAALWLATATASSPLPGLQSTTPRRIVSVVPAVTEMLFAIGAGPQVVGIGSYDMYPPESQKLPRVGALLDPDLERILSLKPDVAVIFETQTDLRKQLERAGVSIFAYRDAGLSDVTSTIRKLGVATAHRTESSRVADAIERGLDDIRRAVSGRPKPRTLLVFGRDRLALRGLYASGGVGFLHDMLEVAGGTNVFSDVTQRAVQASTETILARRPEVILEVRAASGAPASADRASETAVWRTLPSLPAVRSGHVYFLVDDRIVIPGPRVLEGTRLLARTLHPEAF